MIHETIPVPLEGLPEGTRQNGYEDFVVQDLKIEAHNVCYRRLRYLLPDGTSRTAPLPAHVQGHFGPGLRSYVLYQHHQNGVTQPLIHEELLDLGIDISTGQIDRLLTEGHEQFHEEKDALLPAAREVSSYFQADDTGARHLGKNAYTTVIANPLFASFTTTASKSRVNFLKLLRAPHEEYVWSEDALMYAESQGLSLELRARLAGAARKGMRIFSSDKAWERQLAAWKIRGDEPRRIVTEAALFGTLMHYELYVGQPLVSDDAGQFKISGLLHALCWLHAERSIRKLVPAEPAGTRGDRWRPRCRVEVLPASAGLPGIADAAAQGGLGAGLRPAVPAADRLCGPERGPAADSREAGRSLVGPGAAGDSAAQQPLGERHSGVGEEAEDQRRHAERVGPALPRHLCQPEEDLPEAGRILLAVPSGSHTRTCMKSLPCRS